MTCLRVSWTWHSPAAIDTCTDHTDALPKPEFATETQGALGIGLAGDYWSEYLDELTLGLTAHKRDEGDSFGAVEK